MEPRNVTSVEFFSLLGFSYLPHYRLALICIFSFFYLCTLIGNSLIILLIIHNPLLHTPMYFLLANFSFLDLISPSVTVPKMIGDLISREAMISFKDCMTQMFFFITITITECNFLSVMAFDRYIAICSPLHYRTIMSIKMCSILTCGAWILSCVQSLLHTLLTITIDFCGPNHVNHFFCDILSLFHLACSPINLNLALVSVSTFFDGICNCSIILISYIGIVSAVLQINSREGRIKAFCTCGSHLVVVSMYYGTLIITYFRPISSDSGNKDRTAAVIYTAVTPMLNPIIYSLRNKDVKAALRKLLRKGKNY